MQSLRRKLGGNAQGLTYQFEVVAQYATELPLPSGARAQFLLKRRSRLCVTEPEAVDAGGGVEWNTRCVQTATLFKDGDAWRPKEFVFKVQRLLDNPRLGQEAAQTVARAALDLSQFCTAEPFGPKQLVVPLQPAGVLHVSIRTQWLANYDAREADAATDISYMSWGQSVATSGAGAPAASEEQDLSGFDGSAASLAAASLAGLALDGGSIRAVYQPGAVAGGTAGGGGSTATSPLRKRLSAAVMRLPRRGSSARELQQQQQQQQAGAGDPLGWQAAAGGAASAAGGFEFARPRPASSSGPGATAGPPPLLRTMTAPALGASSSTSSAGASRRPVGASLLSIPEPQHGAPAAASEAPTPVLFGAGAGRPAGAWASQQPRAHTQQQPQQPQQPQQLQQDQQQPVAVGLPPEAWSPIDLHEAVQQLYDSEEEPTPRASVLGTVKRMFGRAHNTNLTPPGTTARQLHETFGTPRPTPPACTPNPAEIATIDGEASVSALRRTCKRLAAERDEARAEGFAEAALAVEQGLEIDRLRRAKDGLLSRLRIAEEQLLATFRDEAASDLIQALAEARVEAAQREFQVMELQGQLRKKDALIDKLRAQLTRAEAKYRARLDAVHSPGPLAAALSPVSPGAVLPPWRDEASSPVEQEPSQAGSSAAASARQDSPAALEVRPLGSSVELAA